MIVVIALFNEKNIFREEELVLKNGLKTILVPFDEIINAYIINQKELNIQTNAGEIRADLTNFDCKNEIVTKLLEMIRT